MDCVFYFRGLNTYADDRIRIGPIRAGFMHTPLAKAMSDEKINFRPVLNMKVGRLNETIVRAKEQLLGDDEWLKSKKVDFVGHSTGALIARALIHDPDVQQKVRSLVSIGAPHLGAEAADFALSLPNERSKLFYTLKLVGYDLDRRKRAIADLSPQFVEKFNELFPDVSSVHYACHICEIEHEQQSVVMKAIRKVVKQHKRSDGLITIESQKHGKVLGHYSLDHFTQLGYFPIFDKEIKKMHQKEFNRMVHTTINYWNSLPEVAR